MNRIWTYRKAITAALLAAAAAAVTGLADGHLTSVEIVLIVIALLGGGSVTYAVPNSAKRDAGADTPA